MADKALDLGDGAIVEEGPRVLELTQRQAAEPEGVIGVMGYLHPPGVFSVVRGGVVLCRRIQRLDRVIADPDVYEVLRDELSDSRNVGIVGLLVKHRSAVATEAAGAAALGRGEEEPCAVQLARSQGAVVPREEAIERSGPGDHRPKERRLRAELGLVVHQERQVVL